jgi:uncharacterized membrane protein
MKKQKIKDRFENAINAFFENDAQLNEVQFENSQIVLNQNSSAILDSSPKPETNGNFEWMISSGKLFFLFLPGSFFLFKVSLIFAYITMITYPRTVSNPGKFEYYFVEYLIDNSSVGIFFSLIAVVMTFMGIGSLKETKNLMVPGLIVSFSMLLFGALSFLPEPMRANTIQYYSIYLFPLMLVGVYFVKHRIEEKSEK